MRSISFVPFPDTLIDRFIILYVYEIMMKHVESSGDVPISVQVLRKVASIMIRVFFGRTSYSWDANEVVLLIIKFLY